MAVVPEYIYGENQERQLKELGLSTALIHDGLRRGAERAANRSVHALKTAAGTDIYQDGMEDFARLLSADGWRMVPVDGQPRLIHPMGSVAFTISSGINVGSTDLRRRPRTRRKGKATRGSLGRPPSAPTLFEVGAIDASGDLMSRATSAPFYFLLCERAPRGDGVLIELAQPAGMTNGGSVNQWAHRIRIDFLRMWGDLSVFDHGDDEGREEFDVIVEPR